MNWIVLTIGLTITSFSVYLFKKGKDVGDQSASNSDMDFWSNGHSWSSRVAENIVGNGARGDGGSLLAEIAMLLGMALVIGSLLSIFLGGSLL